MKNTLETRLGLFFALAFVAAVIIFEMIGGLDFFKGGYRVRAQFNNIQELKTGDQVKMAGVQIGQVTSIVLTNNKVEVRMKLNKAEMVRTDSKATVKFVGLLGQNFVAIDFGSPTAPAITENALLETVEGADLSTIMSKLENVATGVENLTKSFSGDTINNLLGPFTDFLKENNPRLTAILGNMQTISTQIAKGEGTVGKLIMDDRLYNSTLTAVTNLNSLSDDLKLTLADAKQTLSGARTAVDSINAGQGTMGKLIKDETLYNETTTAMTNLREILQKINRGEGSVGKLVNDESLFRNAKMTLQKLDKATEGLEDQGPLSVLGIAVGKLF
ncbi:MAG: MlaD family protein [Verrucomicrobiales bacterium]|nr:MlaD family protein [Verrucomicrobiales bacterium]